MRLCIQVMLDRDLAELYGVAVKHLNRQYKGLTVSYSDDFHDCFVLVDNAELHNLGSSVNCLGRRLTTYTTRDRKEIAKLLSQVS